MTMKAAPLSKKEQKSLSLLIVVLTIEVMCLIFYFCPITATVFSDGDVSVGSIYNNRRFLDLMFKVPLEKRISDRHHLDIKKYLNKGLYDMNIRVVNMKETKFRAFALNVIFTINSILPF